MSYTVTDIAKIINAQPAVSSEARIEHLLIDSRKVVFPESALFFAISGPRRDGHSFISELYTRGVRSFVVKKEYEVNAFPDAFFLKVDNVLTALQQLAAFHRAQFNIPVIGITGSNGKTIVKEWLFQLLQADHTIVRSPRSYNSQVGVPLSVWQIEEHHTLAIFEAGISTIGEMDKLEQIILPTFGVLTNLAGAHSEGFSDDRQKAIEKAKLFKNVNTLVFGKEAVAGLIDVEGKDKQFFKKETGLYSWSRQQPATCKIISEKKEGINTVLSCLYDGKKNEITVPFTDRISIDNVITCCMVMLALGYNAEVINERVAKLEVVDMRMQLKKGIHNSYILNDSYSNDTASLDLALDYLQQQAGNKPSTLILSDVLQSGRDENTLYNEIAEALIVRGIRRFIGIGPAINKHRNAFTGKENGKFSTSFYPSTEAFLQQAGTQQFSGEYILLKGARIFEFEKISHWLEQEVHQTVMEINLSAMAHNLKVYQAQLLPTTKLMAMVKAFSYGSGSAEVARLLQFQKVDYLAVAYADEGVELRKAGISLPIMVMNADSAGFDALVTYGLEPEIYSFQVYHAFHQFLTQQGLQQFPVHIKFNTGMNRLGFEVTEAGELAGYIKSRQTMAVQSVFSHLVASESAEHDGFTRQQVTLFENACRELRRGIGYTFIKHIANSAAIHRNAAYQFDMVRLGIGLYGVDTGEGSSVSLETVATLKTTVAQVRKVKAGETVGYGRKGRVDTDSLIATVRIGYADGYSRRLGNGAGKMFIDNRLVPVIGNVCMDMTMLDVTDLPNLSEGDTVEVFGRNLAVQTVADWAGTIAYEIMTGVSQRVKRVYVEE